MRKLRTLDEVTEAYFRDRPEEIDDYLKEIFQDFAEDNDTGVLLASLRILARVRDVSDLAARIGTARHGFQTVPLPSDREPTNDPLLGRFLSFLAKDIQTNPDRLQVVSTDLVNRIGQLAAQFSLDLDATLVDEDE
ncbi:type II toxin-antitoxin system PrlF family antitoxin [Chamaesiphon sp.]|uniref:type II toxin-antitoxin system PrlF family antitoxin n=1 Tax=Chamaesiphon sp. TaxID=2814140 RepID=UPI003593B400